VERLPAREYWVATSPVTFFSVSISWRIAILRNRQLQLMVGWLGVVLLTTFLLVHLWKDLTSEVAAWYFHSTPVWLIVMALGSAVFFSKMRSLRNNGADTSKLFSTLPGESLS
jgi:hypothetical protein